jgi:hypothetical protein
VEIGKKIFRIFYWILGLRTGKRHDVIFWMSSKSAENLTSHKTIATKNQNIFQRKNTKMPKTMAEYKPATASSKKTESGV